MNIPRLRVPIVAQFFAVLVLSLFTYAASAGDDCTYTPTSWSWKNEFQYHYGLQAENTKLGIPTAHIKVQTESVTFSRNGSVKIFLNGNPVTLYTDSDLYNKVPLPIDPNNPTPNDHYNFDYQAGDNSVDFWFKIDFIETSTTIKLKHWVADVGSWDEITWTMNVSCPTTVPDIPVPDDPLEKPRNVSATNGEYKDYVKVTWKAVDGADSYEIWRGTTKSNMERFATDSRSPFKDKDAEEGVKYYYAVKAISHSSQKDSGLSNPNKGYLKEDSGGCSGKDCPGEDGDNENEDNEEVIVTPEPDPELRLNSSNGGSVEVKPSGNSCGNNCYAYNEDDTVMLTANAFSGYNFSRWSGGDCDGNTSSQCSVSMNSDQYVTANFVAKPKHPLNVMVIQSSQGNGTVTASGINCGNDCSETYEEGTSVTLTAKPSPGSIFAGWDGACSAHDTNPSCNLTMNATQTVKATFENKRPKVELKLPEYNAENQELTPTLKWEGTDPEDNTLASYEVLLGKQGETLTDDITGTCTPGSGSGKNGSSTEFTCTLSSSLEYNQWYVWTVTATDAGELTTTKKRSFKTRLNGEPYEAEEPSPALGEEVDSTTDLEVSWKDLPLDQRDPEGETVTYEVFVWETGKTPATVPICSNVSSPTVCTIPATQLDFGKFYSWRVDATDSYGNLRKGSPWSFKTLVNNKPSDLVNPSLVNGQVAIPSPFKDVDPKLPIILNWEGGDDPDSGDIVTQTIEFLGDCSAVTCEEGKEPPAKSCTIPANSLGTAVSCFWQVEAKDNHDNVTMGGPWNFSTMGNQPPSAPTNLVLTNEGQVLTAEDKVNPKREVVFSWDASEDPEGDDITYHLYVQKEGAQNANHYEIKAPSTSQVSDPLDFGSYKWWVVAEDTHGNTAQSEELSFETLEAPSNIELTANSGYANTLLDWDTDTTGIIEYRVLRVLHPEGSETIPEFGVDDEIARTPNLQYTDVDDLPEGQYCYRVEGLDENGDIVSSSVYDKKKVCVTDGEVTLVIESVSGTTGGEVPIEMPNGGSLQIATADICLKYDPDVLEVIDVTTTAFSSGYTFDFDKDRFVDVGILKIKVEAEGGFGDPAVMGPGALADVSFAVKEDRGGKDYSDLEWFEASENEDLVNQPEYAALKNCITVRDDNNAQVEPLGLRDGSFTVRRVVRDGQGTTPARFYVREAYSKGDVDGDGVVGTADARMATGIGVGYYQATPDQINAGDLNSDNKINEADARAIAHYALHQEWLDNDKPPVEGPKTRKRRDGKDTPITFRIGEVSSVSGSKVTVPLSVENLTDMTAMNLAIAYNTAVVEKAKVKKAGLAADAKLLYYDNKKGTVRIGLNSEQPINGGSGVIAEITLTLASGGSIRSTPLVIAKTNLYDMFSRDFVISALQRQIVKQNGEVVLTDVEETVIERNGVEVPIDEIITVEPPVTNSYSASGRITDNNGNSFADVTVTVGDKTTVTDNAGYWAVIGLTEGEYLVRATKYGYTLEQTCVVGNENCHIDFVVETGSETETVGQYAAYGTIKNRHGNPIAGVDVQIAGQTAVTDETGYWAIVGVVAGKYPIKAAKPGHIFLEEQECVVDNDTNCRLSFVDMNEGMASTASCKLFMVHDEKLNQSQFVVVSLDGQYQVSLLGPLYKGRDIEALAIDPRTNIIFAASGNNVGSGHPKGYLYIVDGETGALYPVGSTGFDEIGDLAFGADGTLWAWAKGEGLITIDLITGKGTLIVPADILVEGLTLSQEEEGTVFRGAVDKALWVYNLEADTLDVACTNLPGETEGLETMPDGTLLISIHEDKTLSLHAFDPKTCEVVANADIPTNKDDVEGIALPVEACSW
jgi:hypothetical protein